MNSNAGLSTCLLIFAMPFSRCVQQQLKQAILDIDLRFLVTSGNNNNGSLYHQVDDKERNQKEQNVKAYNEIYDGLQSFEDVKHRRFLFSLSC